MLGAALCIFLCDSELLFIISQDTVFSKEKILPVMTENTIACSELMNLLLENSRALEATSCSSSFQTQVKWTQHSS